MLCRWLVFQNGVPLIKTIFPAEKLSLCPFNIALACLPPTAKILKLWVCLQSADFSFSLGLELAS